ncbi:serine hydrolase domain-containing protein [Nocardioides aestuarii]|uniref:Serine hydrolase domain-containing protein n=1 Tax=Nocardioides aestuarii TaxID=252231 RepID=A0ABW4TJA5_9ACTN
MEVPEGALDDAVTRSSFTGVATVHVAGQRTFERVEGWRHRGYGVPMTVDTRIAVASGGKGFTALAVMRLVEDGTLALDQPVRTLLGDDLPLIDDHVTVEQLLDHTSGIGDYLDEEGDWEPAAHVLPMPVHTLTSTEAFLPALEGYPQKFEPGARFSYCNGSFMVLALLLERATGEVYHDVVRRLVLSPAGMDRTDFLPLNALPGDAATAYVHDEGDLTNTLHLPILGNGDGGVFTTADDVDLFWRAVLDGRIVSPASVDLMTTPRHDVPQERKRYGLGFWLHATGHAVILEGYDAGASFRSTHLVDSATTVTVLGNSSEGAWPVVGVLDDLIDAELSR